MDKDIENMVKSGKSCAPPIKFNPWPTTDKTSSRLHIDYVGPIKETHLFVIVDNFTKWPEVFKRKTPTTSVCKIRFARNQCV